MRGLLSKSPLPSLARHSVFATAGFLRGFLGRLVLLLDAVALRDRGFDDLAGLLRAEEIGFDEGVGEVAEAGGDELVGVQDRGVDQPQRRLVHVLRRAGLAIEQDRRAVERPGRLVQHLDLLGILGGEKLDPTAARAVPHVVRLGRRDEAQHPADQALLGLEPRLALFPDGLEQKAVQVPDQPPHDGAEERVDQGDVVAIVVGVAVQEHERLALAVVVAALAVVAIVGSHETPPEHPG